MTSQIRRRHLLLTCAIAALVLTGCGKSDRNNTANTTPNTAPPPLAALPLATGKAPAAAPAPPATQLPPPPTPIHYASPAGDDYAYLDQAYALRQSMADAPPDFTYDYDGQRPMTWRADDGSECIAEQLPDGNLRYYFYQRGASEPYLVQDPDYSYGYADGTLVVVYDADGNVVPADMAQRQEDIAGRYLARAEALHHASVRQQHKAVAEANWERQRERVYQDEQRWEQAQGRDAAWRAYHQQQQDQEQAHWAQERYRRESEAFRFAHAIKDTAAIARAAQGLADATDAARRHNESIPGGAPLANNANLPPSPHPPPRAMAPQQGALSAPSEPDRNGGYQRHGRATQAPQQAAAPPPARHQREENPRQLAPAAAPAVQPPRGQREQHPPQPAQASAPRHAAAPPPQPGRNPRQERASQEPPQAALAPPPSVRDQREQRTQRTPQTSPASPPASAVAPPAPPREQRHQRASQAAHAAAAPAAPAAKVPPLSPKPPAAAPTKSKPVDTDHGKKPPRDRKDEQPNP